jgi:hypothetical protein
MQLSNQKLPIFISGTASLFFGHISISKYHVGNLQHYLLIAIDRLEICYYFFIDDF